MSEDQRKGFELRGWHVIVGLLAVLVVMFILFRVFGHSALERKIAELRAKGYPTSFEELEKYNQIPEGVPNAADLYLKAFDAYRAPFEDEKKFLPYIGSVVLKAGESLTPETKTAMETFLSRNAKTLELLHQAGQVEQCRYQYPMIARQGFMNPYYNEIKNCAQLINQCVLIQIQSDRKTEACQSVIDELRLGRSLSREPSFISFLMGHSVASMGVESIQRLLGNCSLSEQQISILHAELLHIRNRLRLDQGLIGERCCLLDSLFMNQSMGFGTVPARWSGLMDTNVLRAIEFYDQLEAVAKMEPEKRLKEYQRIQEESKHLSVLFFITRTLVPAVNTIAIVDLRRIAQLDCARAGLGVERFRLAEGRLPETLEQLVPKFIEAVPIDPFDGKPLKFKRLEKGYTIYSVGEDGEDNGGIPKSKVQKDEKFDLPFTVERP
jgi:hypothetical protein